MSIYSICPTASNHKENLAKIKSASAKVHKDRLLIYYTCHDYDHSKRMEAICNQLVRVRKVRLSDREKFLLSAAIYLHDIGIQLFNDDELAVFAERYKLSVPTDKEEKGFFVRANHPLLSSFWIRRNQEGNSLEQVFFGDSRDSKYVQMIVESHGMDDFTKCVDETIYDGGETIRMWLLCAMLCLADAMDCDYRRVDQKKIDSTSMPSDNRVHWLKHIYTRSINVDNNIVRLCFDFPSSLNPNQLEVYRLYFVEETLHWIKTTQDKYWPILNGVGLVSTFDTRVGVSDDLQKLTDSEYVYIEKKNADFFMARTLEEAGGKLATLIVGIMVHNGKVLMVERRSPEKNEDMEGDVLCWQFPAGYVKQGFRKEEDRLAKLVAEVKKETGLSCKPIKEITYRRHPTTKNISYYWAIEYCGGDLINGQPDENEDVAWVPLDEYREKITSDLSMGVIEYLKVCQEHVNKNEVSTGIVANGGKVLIAKRKHSDHAVLWSFPGGKIHPDESEADAAEREVLEETGLRTKVVKFLGDGVHPNTKKHISYWACNCVDGDVENLVAQKSEIADLKWVEISELNKYFTSPIFQGIKDYLGIKEEL